MPDELTMRKISEDEAFALASEMPCPILFKEESEPMEAAVCLKQFPTGYVLGASDKSGELRIWFSTDYAAMEERYRILVQAMKAKATPLTVHEGE